MVSQAQSLVNRILVGILILMLVLAGTAAAVTAAPQSGAGEISGVVFFDRNGNGMRDAGENGIAGVVVELRDAATNGQALRRQATTDAGGVYRFTNVPAGTYMVVRPEDALYVNTTAGQQLITLDAGKGKSSDMRAPADGDVRRPVDAQPRAAADFGASPALTLVGTYFDDRNGDGVQGLGERGIPGVQVRLYDDPKGLRRVDAAATELGSAVTDAQGHWIIRNVKPGKRVVLLRTPDGAHERQMPVTLEASEVSATVALDEAANASASPCDDPNRPAYQAGEAIVGFRAGIAFERAAALLSEHGASIKQAIADDTYLVTAAEEKMATLLSALASRPEVRYAERNGIACAGLTPTDPDYSNPYLVYAPQLLNAPAAWDVTTGTVTVTVAVVDSGVSLSHPEFAGRILPGYDFVNGDSDPSDDNGHGTHVAGIIAAAMNNGLGTTGLAPNVAILPVKVLSAAKSGTWANVAQGIRYAADNGARVINLSLGGTTPSTAVLDAIRYAQSKGALVVAAAGNNGSSAPFYPAYYEEVVAVSATDEHDEYWSISNYGSWVDVAAPGSSIWSTYWTATNPNGFGFMSGTSMAAPHVSALAALIWSVNGSLSPAQVRDIIQSTAVDKGAAGFDPYYGWGRIDVGAAVRRAAAGGTGSSPTATPTTAPTATPTTAPTATPQPTATPTTAPTATPQPTATPTTAPTATPTTAPTATPTTAPTATPASYVQRVNSGGPTYTDGQGWSWAADKAFATGSWGYVGGSAKSSTMAVAGTTDDFLFQKYREGMSEYRFTVPNGTYQVELSFVEFAANKAGERVMRITLEGATVENALDVYATVGKGTLLQRSYTVTVSDGVLNIGFAKNGGSKAPMVSAITVKTNGATPAPGAPTPTPTPVRGTYTQRVDAGGPTYTDSAGVTWQSDQAYVAGGWGYVGGTTQVSSSPVAGANDPFVFQRYREGMSEYRFTVPNGTYTVRLRFAEFVADRAGQRVMRISLEGAEVESALDVYAVAGRATAVERTYTVTVNDGLLNIGFAQVGGIYAPMIAAIAIE